MIPVLYAEDAIVLQHDTNTGAYSYAFPENHGLGSLSEAISCKVTEERNGQYELEMEYPVTGKRFQDLKTEALIKAAHDDTKDQEFFRIYKISKPMSGRVTVSARHFSYYLSKVTVMPFSGDEAALGPGAALRKMSARSVPRHGFTFTSDISSTAKYELKEPKTFRNAIGGTAGSVLESFGGELEWKLDTVRLWSSRNLGLDSGVVLRYGKNLMDLKATEDTSAVWTGIMPFWKGQYTSTSGRTTDLITHADEPVYASNVDDYVFRMVIPVDLSSQFESDEKVTKEALVEKAQAYIRANAFSAIPTTIEVSFIPLWQTEEYKSVAALERLKLCDTLTVRHEGLGIDYTAKIVKVEYDVLKERYISMTIGQANSNFVDSVRGAIDDATAEVPTMSAMQQAIAHATRLIQGGAGGHMVTGFDEDGKPHELYFMDTDDVNTAMNVLRINMNGIGFSSTGFDGPYHSAWTLDGKFVADYICVGSINASLIKTGELDASLITTGAFKIVKKDEYGNPVLVDGKEQVALLADADRGKVHIVADDFSLSNGGTIESIAQGVVDTYDESVQEYLRGFQEQLDGKTEWYFINGTPSSVSGSLYYDISPNKDWTTTEQKQDHVGDCCYALDTGKAYKWMRVCYGTWVEFSADSKAYDDSDYVKIFTVVDGSYKLVGTWKGTEFAGKKVFVPSNTVYVYWHTGTSGHDAYGFRLTGTRGYGDCNAGIVASGTAYSSKDTIHQFNNKVPIWSNGTRSGSTLESAHNPYADGLDDVYVWTVGSATVSYNYDWVELEDASVVKALSAAAQAQDTADGKRRNFHSTPTPPYDVGDIWMDGKEIKTCIVARKQGQSYAATDWVSKNDYKDGDYIAQKIQDLDDKWSDEDTVFENLFANGQRGIKFDPATKKMYISMDLMKGGTVKLGGTANDYGDGKLYIYDANGNRIIGLDKGGMDVKDSAGNQLLTIDPGSGGGLVMQVKDTRNFNIYYLDKETLEYRETYYDSNAGVWRNMAIAKVSGASGFQSFSRRGTEVEELRMQNAILYGYQGGTNVSLIDFSADIGGMDHPMVLKNVNAGFVFQGYKVIFADLNGNQAMTVSHNEGIFAHVTTSGFSDARAKEHITPSGGFRDKLRRLQVVSFDWKDGHYPGHVSAGLIAQQVKEVIPELVTLSGEGWYGISFDNLVPFLLSAVQEQDDEISGLKKKVSDLEARLEALEKLVQNPGKK